MSQSIVHAPQTTLIDTAAVKASLYASAISSTFEPSVETKQSHPFPLKDVSPDPENVEHARNAGPDGKPPGLSPAAVLQDGHRPQWISLGSKVDRIAEIISRHIFKTPEGDRFEIEGRPALKALIARYIERGERMELVFPAFPFKSPGRGKVLGTMPDLGEELLLRKLESLARTIEDYHPPGALIRIVSDGIVYGELLGGSDSIVYRYNDELRRMCDEFSLTHISFVRIIDLVTDAPISDRHMSEQEYVESVPKIRSLFLAHKIPGYDLAAMLKDDVGTMRTYLGYLKFLIKDLEGSSKMQGPDGKPMSGKAQTKARHVIAKAMLENGAKFSDLVRIKFPTAIRLSVHAHNNAGPKYAFSMPGGDMSRTPWHNVVREEIDGKLIVAPLFSFDTSAYEIVHRYGRPYYFRARSEELDLGEKVNPHVEFIRNYPFGMIVKADPAAKLRHDDLPMDKIRKLALRYSVMLFQGFVQPDKETFRRVAREMGDVVQWPYGDLLELKENPAVDMNSALTCESLPMHYDGVFKTKIDEKTNKLTHDPPTFQVFVCVQAPEKAEGGKTLITNTAAILAEGLTPEQRTWLSERKFSAFTPLNEAFGGDRLSLPLVMHNEKTGHDVLRWHETWPQWATKYKPIEACIAGVSPEASLQIGQHLTDLLYDRRFCYAHAWTTGDFLIADNIELIHTRTAFKPCPRELWRIHVN